MNTIEKTSEKFGQLLLKKKMVDEHSDRGGPGGTEE